MVHCLISKISYKVLRSLICGIKLSSANIDNNYNYERICALLCRNDMKSIRKTWKEASNK